MNDDWSHQQQMDEQERQQIALEALRAAQQAGTPDTALMALALECGVANDFYKELRK